MVGANQAGTWITGSAAINISRLTGTGLPAVPPATAPNVWKFKFKDHSSLQTALSTSGEFRYLSATINYSPITADLGDRIALNPYFQNSSSLNSAAEFVQNGRKIRRGDASFRVSLTGPSEAEQYDLTKDVPGGLDIFWFDNSGGAGKHSSFGVVTCEVIYQVKWKKPSFVNHDAS